MNAQAYETEATLSRGGLTFHNMKVLFNAICGFFGILEEPQKVLITIRLWEQRRSLAANRYYWGVVVKAVADETGHPKDAVHEYLKLRVNAQPVTIVDPATGEILDTAYVGGSTKRMSKKAFAEYVMAAELFATEFFGIRFDPNNEDRRQTYGGGDDGE